MVWSLKTTPIFLQKNRHKLNFQVKLSRQNKNMKGAKLMSTNNYITKLLNLKEENINFYNVAKEIIKNTETTVIYGKLINKPDICPCCRGKSINVHGYKESTIKIMPISGYNALLKLKKQRYKCKSCQKTFIAQTNLVEKNCYISKDVKNMAALLATNKISEKDIGKQLNISHNTVSRVINTYYENHKINYNYLPKALCFDEFKSTKDSDGAMSFIYCDAQTHNIIDIVENRQLSHLKKYFSRYTKKARNNVKYIVMDMYKPYITLVEEMFPNAEIIMDKFHIINNLSRALNKTRIKLMKVNPKLYNKLKNYYKLLLKDRYQLDGIHYYRYKCFDKMMSQRDIVDYLINQDEELNNTYELYQQILCAIKTKNINYLIQTVNGKYDKISDYMQTAVKTCKKYIKYIVNAVKYNFTNGVIEGINNKIKTLKRIAFGYRSFLNFKNRILIMCNLISLKKERYA